MEESSADSPLDKPANKGINLKDWIAKRVPVQTSKGTVYARPMTHADLNTLGLASLARRSKEDMDFRAVGRMALLTLVARDETGDKEPALSADDVESLSAEDAKRLSEGIAKACGASLPSTADGALVALGSVLYEQACQQQRRMAELIESAKSPLGKAFDAVPATVRAQLADQFRRIEELSLGLQASRLVQEHMKDDLVSRMAADVRKIAKDRRPIVEPASTRTSLDVQAPPIVEVGKESLEHLRETAERTAELTSYLANMNRLAVEVVLPAWHEQRQKAAADTKKGLRAAIATLVVSVLVTVGVAVWQHFKAKSYQEENGRQQTAIEALLRKQLDEATELNSRLREDSRALRETLRQLETAIVREAARPGATQSKLLPESNSTSK